MPASTPIAPAPRRPGDDGFDFRGVQWLGRDRDISTAVSARAFRDVRQAPPSRARAEYLGFGQNEPARGYYLPAGGGTRGGAAATPAAPGRSPPGAGRSPPRSWSSPAAPPRAAQAGQAEIVTGAAFTDTAITGRADLDQLPHPPFRHPRPGDAAAAGMPGAAGAADQLRRRGLGRPAELLARFSTCGSTPTSSSFPPATPPGRASATATEEAGLTGGGEFALDGLVRAFVGAGGRMVIASHWPVPDDFNATERLISGLFTAPPGTGTARRAAAAPSAR